MGGKKGTSCVRLPARYITTAAAETRLELETRREKSTQHLLSRVTAGNKKTKVGYTCSIIFFLSRHDQKQHCSRDTIGRRRSLYPHNSKHLNETFKLFFLFFFGKQQLFGICLHRSPRPLRPHADPVERGGGGEGGVGEEEREWKLGKKIIQCDLKTIYILSGKSSACAYLVPVLVSGGRWRRVWEADAEVRVAVV